MGSWQKGPNDLQARLNTSQWACLWNGLLLLFRHDGHENLWHERCGSLLLTASQSNMQRIQKPGYWVSGTSSYQCAFKAV